MENSINNQNEQVEEEIPTIDQFQVGRSTPEEKDLESTDTTTALADGDTAEEDAGYTSEEVEFADGEGTLLDEELSVDPEDDDLEDDDLDDEDLEDDEDIIVEDDDEEDL
ncbi:hypothetical protein LPB86_13235 [Pedobacter sp. MC2016-14]|uniref:hypothetical protein n=1 Tax=Pedobacter sp. MC2016-14 TaxID=2897327 RepID=UPI001E45DFA1|nr:hypothetical protein [Pedobacter sp. MC2016-14]MCD0489198.1 hypothetical protein [Pedobacter sp. MC2016-14]